MKVGVKGLKNNFKIFHLKITFQMLKRSFWEWVLKGIDNWWPLSFLEPRFLHKPSNPHLHPPPSYFRKHHENRKNWTKDACSRTRGWCVSEFWSWNEVGEKIKQSLFFHPRGQGRDMLLSEKQNRHFQKLQAVAINRKHPFNKIISRFSF